MSDESNSPVPFDVDSNLPAIPGMEDFSGYEGLTDDSFVIPRAKIVQPTSKEGDPGTIHFNLTEEAFDELDLIVIKAEVGRVQWNEDPSIDEPVCRTYNCLTPDPSIENPISPKCGEYAMVGRKRMWKATCPDAEWGQKDGKPVKPKCPEVFSLLCLMLPDGLPFWLNVTGASVKPLKKYISAIALRRKKLFEYSAHLKLALKTEPHRHYVANFGTPVPVSPEVLAELSEVILGIKDESIERAEQAEEAAKAAAGATEPGEEETQDEVPEWMADGKTDPEEETEPKTKGKKK